MRPTPFQERREHELDGLSDEDLVAHIRAAAAAGRSDQVKSAIAILSWRYHGNLRRRVAIRVPEADIDDVVQTILESAMKSAFDGGSVGEFRSWLNTIADRRVADYHKKRESRPKEDPLPTENLGNEQVWGEEPSEPFEGDALPAREAVRKAYGERPQEHQRVLDLYEFGPHSAAETAEQIPDMTEDNVHQIHSRFKARVEELLDGTDADTEPDDDDRDAGGDTPH